MTPRLPLQRLIYARVMVVVALSAALLLAGLWFLHNYEQKPYEVYRGISPAARNNHLLAAEKYLQAIGREAVSRKGMEFLRDLPQAGDAIVIAYLPKGLSKAINDEIMAWVEAGGQLLITPGSQSSEGPERDDLLSRLGVQTGETDRDGDCGCPDKADEKEATESGRKTPPKDQDAGTIAQEAEPSESVITLQLDNYPISLRYNEYIDLLTEQGKKADFIIAGSHRLLYENQSDQEQTKSVQLVKEEANWLLEYTIGAGKITVLSDMSVLQNDGIGQYDHAFFLSWLLRGRPRIWLLYAADARPLPVILWKLSPRFWLSLLVLLILVLWRMQRQSGTLLLRNLQTHRNLLAHIDGSGQYSWRLDSAAALIDDNRKTLLNTWLKRKLGHSTKPATGDIGVGDLAERTGLTTEELETAMTLKVISEQDLIRTSRAMQRLRLLLQGGESTRYDR